MKKFRKIFLLLVVVFAFGFIKPVHATPAGGHGEFTQDEFDEIFGGITLNFNEKDYYEQISDGYSYGYYRMNDAIISAVSTSADAKFDASGYGDDFDITSIRRGDNIYDFVIQYERIDHEVSGEGIIHVSYNDTDTSLATAKTAMSSQLDSYYIPTLTFDLNSKEIKDLISASGVYYQEPLLVKLLNDYNIKKTIKEYLNDSNVEVVLEISGFGFGGAILNEDHQIEYSGFSAILEINIYKNNMFYTRKKIEISPLAGFKSKDGYDIMMVALDKTQAYYSKMVEELGKLGAENVIYAYYLEHTNIGAPMTPTTYTYNMDLYVGEEYNGKYVTVLHEKQDGSYEHFLVKVKDGKASITTNELSPFMVAVNKDQAAAAKAAGETTTTASSNPQTSSVNILLYIIVASLSLVGIVYLAKRKKRIV